MLRTDIFQEFKYEPGLNRYRIVSGSGKGQFISKEAFISSTERYVVEQSKKLINLGYELSSQKISLEDFQSSAAKYLKEIHISQVILGNGGIEGITAGDWGNVGNTLKAQYYSGVDSKTGSRYGLKWLVRDLKEGKVSESQLINRLGLYARSGKLSYWKQRSRKEGTKDFARRTLGASEHCPDCVRYAALGIQPKERLPLPLEACECRTNCKCSITFMSFEEAVKKGWKGGVG